MTKDVKLPAGTIICVPLPDGNEARGKIIAPGIDFFVGFSSEKFEADLPCQQIASSDLAIFAWTNDAEIYRGAWRICGHDSSDAKIDLPEYLINRSGELFVESFDASSYREFIPGKDDALSYRKLRSPKLVQRALRAYFDFEEWNEGFNDMLLNLEGGRRGLG